MVKPVASDETSAGTTATRSQRPTSTTVPASGVTPATRCWDGRPVLPGSLRIDAGHTVALLPAMRQRGVALRHGLRRLQRAAPLCPEPAPDHDARASTAAPFRPNRAIVPSARANAVAPHRGLGWCCLGLGAGTTPRAPGGDGSGDRSSLERPNESMPITLAGSERRRVVERDAGAGAADGAADGSIQGWRAAGRDRGTGRRSRLRPRIDRRRRPSRLRGPGGRRGRSRGPGRCRVRRRFCRIRLRPRIDRTLARRRARYGAGAVAGSAHGFTVVAGRRCCAAPAGGVFGAAGRGDVACGVGSAVCGAADGIDRVAGVLGCVASLPGAGAAGGVAFTRAARAGGLFESKGGGSVGFLTWSEDAAESAGPAVFAGGEIRVAALR